MSPEAIQRRRKLVFPFHYAPGKRLLQIVVNLRERPGALAEVLVALGSKVNLIGSTSYRTGTSRGIFSGIGEFLSEKDGPKDIEALVAPLRSVVACQVWESREGLLVDRFHSGVESGMGEPYIMLPAAGLAQTFDKLIKTFGTGGETILYLEGKDFGLARFSLYRKMLGDDPAGRSEEAAHIFEALGYGTGAVEMVEPGKMVRIVRRECFECEGQPTNGHSCAFSRGLASGIFEALYGAPMTCEEVGCRLKGADRCEFVVKPRSP